MTSVQDILNSRRTVYRFTERVVEESNLEIAFEAASNAPCHKQTRPWNYYVLGLETRRKLLPTVISMAKEKASKAGGDGANQSVNRAVSKIMDTPTIIAVTTKLSPKDSFREEEDYAATVCSLHNLVLSLWGMGIGSQWSTGSLTRHPSTYSVLGIDGERERVVGFLKAGYPESIPKIEKKSSSDIRKYLP
jgi:nitroreductase